MTYNKQFFIITVNESVKANTSKKIPYRFTYTSLQRGRVNIQTRARLVYCKQFTFSPHNPPLRHLRTFTIFRYL